MHQLIRPYAQAVFAVQLGIIATFTACAADSSPEAAAVEGEKLYLAETTDGVAGAAPSEASPPQDQQEQPFADGEYSIDSADDPSEPPAKEGEFDKARTCHVDLQWCRNPASGSCHNIPLCRTYSCQDRAENPNNDQVGRYCTSLIRQVCGNVGRYCYTKN